MSAIYHPPAHHPHYLSPEQQESQRKLIDLEFQYHYVVDQLVYYSTIKTGENFFQLASLLFCSLLGNRIFQIWSPAYLRDPRINPTAMTNATMNGGDEARGASGDGGQEQQSSQPLKQSALESAAGVSGFTMADNGHLRALHDDEDEDDENENGGEEGNRRRREAQKIRVWPESLRKWVRWQLMETFFFFWRMHLLAKENDES